MEFHERLAKLKFLDPACGCGNFLVIAYRELRLLELDILRVVYGKAGTRSLDVSQFNILCDVDQFFGIEIEEFPAQIAQTALWLMDHQMNILGNPPFGGKQYQSDEQKADMARVFHDVRGAGVLDFVAPWYRRAAEFMAGNPAIKTAFVSTNSITQGEQVGILWPDLLSRGVKINFAHRTFQWSSEARGRAAVHCVIIGFALHDIPDKRLFDYEDPQATAHEIKVKNINPYLVDASDIFLEKRRQPIEDVPELVFGNMPNDGGNLLLTKAERDEISKKEPNAAPYIRRFIGSKEYINGIERYCIWLQGVSPTVLKSMPLILDRIERVRAHRLASPRPTTQSLARVPMLFGEIRQPPTDYFAIPEVSSERRHYIPMGFVNKNVIPSNKIYAAAEAVLYHFGVLSSAMHMAWTRAVCGRLESRYQYSSGIVYNNFPWPQAVTDKQRQAIEQAAQAVLDARAKHPDSTLADLYDPLTMPPDLVRAHHRLDAAVDAAYSKKKFSGDRDRLAFLFELYQQISSPLESKKVKRRKEKVKAKA